VNRQRVEKGLLALVGHGVVGDLDHKDVEPVAGVVVGVRAAPVRAHADRVVAVQAPQGEDGDPPGIALGQVLQAVLVLAEPRLGLR
jgi:hypothetical protein